MFVMPHINHSYIHAFPSLAPDIFWKATASRINQMAMFGPYLTFFYFCFGTSILGQKGTMEARKRTATWSEKKNPFTCMKESSISTQPRSAQTHA